MTVSTRWLAPSFWLLAMALRASVAFAEPTAVERADQLFQEGAALMGESKFAEACTKFEESQALDPAIGTKFRIAECNEGRGRWKLAGQLFLEVAKDSRYGGRTDREKEATARAAQVFAKLPKLAFEGVDGAEGLSITVDGELVPREEWGGFGVDPGSREVVVSAPNHKPFSTKVTATQATVELVKVPPLEATVVAPPPPPTPPAESPSGLHGQQIGAIISGGVGVAGLGLGIAMGVVAGNTWSDAKSECSDPDGLTGCSALAVDLQADAELFAALSTTGFVVAGVGMGLFPVLWFTTPESKSSGVPDAAALVVVGAF